jgi:hypothetical protein
MTELIKQFELLNNDAEKWQWIVDNKHLDFYIILDNDQTTICDNSINNEETYCDDIEYHANFEGFIGCNQGAIDLLSAIGIKSEKC